MRVLRRLLFPKPLCLPFLYLLRSLLRTLILWIQRSFWQVLASAVPFLFPKPLCLPFLLASLLALTRDREWTATGFLMTRLSLISFLMLALELALAISLISLGSSHTFFFPHFITSEARRFWSFSELILGAHDYLSCRSESSNISLV